jgi:hypothetical protein
LRERELIIVNLFGSGEKSYELLLSLLVVIQTSTIGIKYHIDTTPSIKFGVEIFNRVVWAFGPCIAARPYLWTVMCVDADFLSGRYADKLFMTYAYDAE